MSRRESNLAADASLLGRIRAANRVVEQLSDIPRGQLGADLEQLLSEGVAEDQISNSHAEHSGHLGQGYNCWHNESSFQLGDVAPAQPGKFHEAIEVDLLLLAQALNMGTYGLGEWNRHLSVLGSQCSRFSAHRAGTLSIRGVRVVWDPELTDSMGKGDT